MTIAENDIQEQHNFNDATARLDEILSLAKEIEHLTKSEEN